MRSSTWRSVARRMRRPRDGMLGWYRGRRPARLHDRQDEASQDPIAGVSAAARGGDRAASSGETRVGREAAPAWDRVKEAARKGDVLAVVFRALRFPWVGGPRADRARRRRALALGCRDCVGQGCVGDQAPWPLRDPLRAARRRFAQRARLRLARHARRARARARQRREARAPAAMPVPAILAVQAMATSSRVDAGRDAPVPESGRVGGLREANGSTRNGRAEMETRIYLIWAAAVRSFRRRVWHAGRIRAPTERDVLKACLRQASAARVARPSNGRR